MDQSETHEQTSLAVRRDTALLDIQAPGSVSTAPPVSTADTPQALPDHDAEQAAVHSRWQVIRIHLLTTAEALVIIVWACAFAAPYLTLDTNIVPSGREYLSSIQSHVIWSNAQKCGMCALWNGNVRGGSPALSDVYGSMLHPVVIVTTLMFGVLNGSKLATVGMFLMAGLSQWWLGRELQLGRVARLWGALLVVVAGHLGGRMELGPPGLIISTVACALVLPALLRLMRIRTRRAAVLLALTLAAAATGGHGYIQVGLLFCMLAALWLWPWERAQSLLMVRRFALAGVLSLLLAAPLLVPVLHFLPQFVKDSDPAFTTAQPMGYAVLNLVINDPDFYTTEVLGKLGYPYLYTLYIGWIPVLLALLGLHAALKSGRAHMAAFLLTFALIAFWVGSAAPLKWLSENAPASGLRDLLIGMRHPQMIAGLAIAPLVGLASIGLDYLMGLNWPRWYVGLGSGAWRRMLRINLRWIMIIPLVLALQSAWTFSRTWIYTVQVQPGLDYLLEALRTPDLQWVSPPFGEHQYVERATRLNLKMSTGFRTWNWRDRPFPLPVLEANRLGPPPHMNPEPVMVEDGVPIYAAPPGYEYAAVEHSDGERTVCQAYGRGGNIDVHCDLPQPGVLQVIENNWTGWHATLEGRELPLRSGTTWLMVDDVPAGDHVIKLRYRPWDVWIGVGLAGLGVVIALLAWWWPGRAAPGSSATDEQHTEPEQTL